MAGNGIESKLEDRGPHKQGTERKKERTKGGEERFKKDDGWNGIDPVSKGDVRWRRAKEARIPVLFDFPRPFPQTFPPFRGEFASMPRLLSLVSLVSKGCR